ncbi:hypothetical protein GCM10028777_24900 [Angustibacter speluncae]
MTSVVAVQPLNLLVLRDPDRRPGGDMIVGTSTIMVWTVSADGVTQWGADALMAAWEWLIENAWDLESGCLEGFRSFDLLLAATDDEDESIVRFVLEAGHLQFVLSSQHFTPATVSALTVGLREYFVSQGAVAPHRPRTL